MKPTNLALLLTAYLGDYLPTQRKLRPNTIRGYRDAFILLLRYCRDVRNLPVERLDLVEVDAPLVLAFLEHLEKERRGSPATRNHRLTAIHSFFRYVQTEAPEHLVQCQRILAIPVQRTHNTEPTYLCAEDLAVLLQQPNCSTRTGRRDAVLFSVLYDTGARVQEIIDLRVRDVRLETPAMVRLTGKGQKTRHVPLMPSTVELLKYYLREEMPVNSDTTDVPLFRNRRGEPFSRWGIRYLLIKYSDLARRERSTLPAKVTPHTLRHTKAMHLLQAGNPAIVIRDILGHAHIQSTEVYARADLEMKRRALEKAANPAQQPDLKPWQKDAELLRWLQSL